MDQLTPENEVAAHASPATTSRIRVLQLLGVFCGLAAGAWLGSARRTRVKFGSAGNAE